VVVLVGGSLGLRRAEGVDSIVPTRTTGATEDGTSGQVDCTLELEPTDQPVASAASGQDSSRVTSATATPPAERGVGMPREALGFVFGETSAQVKSACTDAGYDWEMQAEKARCSGTPAPIGLETLSKIEFCDDALCALTVVVAFDIAQKGANKSFLKIVNSLKGQYGTPLFTRTEVPGDCSEDLLGCVIQDKASWKAKWKWKGEGQIAAKTFAKDGVAHLAVRYQLASEKRTSQKPEQSVNTSAF